MSDRASLQSWNLLLTGSYLVEILPPIGRLKDYDIVQKSLATSNTQSCRHGQKPRIEETKDDGNEKRMGINSEMDVHSGQFVI